MSHHSVSRHLRIAIDRYDAAIRQWIRGYEEMLDAAVDAVLEAGVPGRVVDLGSGTGALAERLLDRCESCVVELWDVDPAMLRQASERLARFGQRALPRERSFEQPLGGVDAAMASLALHHVRDLGEKTALYRALASELRPGGLLVTADVTIPADPADGAAEYRAWADHQVAAGIAEEEAWAHFEEWAEEDRYFSLEEELGALSEAGFEPKCTWRLPPSTVIAARIVSAKGVGVV